MCSLIIKNIVENDRKILSETNSFKNVEVSEDGVIRVPKSSLCCGLGRHLRSIGIQSKIEPY